MMGKRKSYIAATLLGAAMMTVSSGYSQANHNAAFMKVGSLTSIPVGHYMFCKALPQECRTRTREDVRVALSSDNWQDLLRVNHYANQSIRSVTDAELYGTEEHWTYPSTAGDCEDYVLLKRKMLIERGWPAGALLITVVRQSNGEGHAVLTVRTDRGDLILDNLENRVKLWHETPYVFVKRQSKNHTGKWESINDFRVSSVGAISQ